MSALLRAAAPHGIEKVVRQGGAVLGQGARDGAHGVLGATHALELKLSGTGSDISGAARLIDLDSGRSTRTLEGTYARDDPPAMARAFAAIVSEAFRATTSSASLSTKTRSQSSKTCRATRNGWKRFDERMTGTSTK